MPSLIAIDLGSFAVKVTALRRTGRRVVVEGSYAQRVPQDGAEVPELATRLVALDELLEEHAGWRSPDTEVLTALSADQTVMRRLRVPVTDKAQVAAALPFAVEGEVPFDLDEMVMGHRLFPGVDHTNAVVVIARREPVEALVGALRERRVDPSAVYAQGDLAPMLAPPTGLIAVLDVGHAHSVLSIVRDGHTELVRSIDVAGLAFTRAIASALGCDFAQATRLKHAAGGEIDPEATDPGEGGHALPAEAATAVEAQMSLLLAEVRSTLIDAEDRLGNGIEQVVLTGGGSRLAPLHTWLNHDLGVPVAYATDRAGDVLVPEHGLLTTLAELLTGTGRGKPVDLRQGELAFRGGFDVLKTVAGLCLAGVGFLSLAALAIFVVQVVQLRAERARVDALLVSTVSETFPDAGSVTTLTALSVVAAAVAESSERAKVLGVDNAEPPTPAMLLALTEAFPPHPDVVIDVNELSMTPRAITFSAETDSYATAAAVETALKSKPMFKLAEKSNEQKRSDKVTFTMTIALADAGEEG